MQIFMKSIKSFQSLFENACDNYVYICGNQDLSVKFGLLLCMVDEG